MVDILFYFIILTEFFPELGMESKDADWMVEQLYHELPWRQRLDVRNGETFLQPHLTVIGLLLQ